ncbi:MAG TPA: glycosyltransferase family 39 protein, partial [Verrucomicrobiae bacterium]|nr:glycosyltransferase family 39 protein [Verrucomicrobiae bacterium]
MAIPPSKQDFPLGDDWAFAHSAIWFAQGRGIHYIKWASMPQLGQWLWSWPFLQVIPWPNFALRLGVIVLSWLGLAAFCDLLWLENVPVRLAVFATCVLALNPLFFVSQGTYMTDVPALSFALLALDFYSRAMADKNVRWLLPATLFAVLAVITRQTMLALPLAVAVLALRNPEIRRNAAWHLCILVPLAVCLYTAWWFSRQPDVVVMRAKFRPEQMLLRPFVAFHLAGLTVVPLFFLRWWKGNWRLFLVLLAAVFLVAGHYMLAARVPYGGLFPYYGGMLSLQGTYSEGLVAGQRDILLTPALRFGLTIPGCVGAALILTAIWQMFRDRKFPGLLLVFTLMQLAILLVLPALMDRYLEVLFPGAILLAATQCSPNGIERPGRIGWTAGVVTVAVSGLIAIAFSHDLLAWNTVRWNLGREAVAKGITPADIEGGFEWNGWYERNDPDWKPSLARRSAADDDPASLTLP